MCKYICEDPATPPAVKKEIEKYHALVKVSLDIAIEQLIKDAQERTAQNAQLTPTALIDCIADEKGVEGKKILTMFADLPETAGKRREMMFGLGVKMQQDGNSARTISFATEAYTRRLQLPKDATPEQLAAAEAKAQSEGAEGHPDTVEALIICGMGVDGQEVLWVRPFERKDGKLAWLDEPTIDYKTEHNHLLRAFFAGQVSVGLKQKT